MKDLRVFLPVLLLILIVFLLTGCGGFVPSPGATDDDTTVSGQILMPLCCLTEEQIQDTENSVSRYSGYECTPPETDFWSPAAETIVELRKYNNCKVRYTTTTDESGYYEFTDVTPGLYILTSYCPTDKDFPFVKDVIEKSAGEALDAGIPDCDSTSLAFVIEYIGDTYCHCQWICPCFNEEWSDEYKLIEEIANSESVNMQVNIPAIIAHEKFGTLCNVDTEGNDINDDLVDLVCAKLNSCCFSPGQTNGNGGDDDTPGISLTKEADVDCYTPGGTIEYTLTVENTGELNFNQLRITDTRLGLNNTPVGPLATGNTWSNTYDYIVPEEFEGELTNIAEATGSYAGGNISATDTVTLDPCETPPSADLTILKDAGDDTDTVFSFTIAGDTTAFSDSFDLTGGQSKVYTDLAPDTYTITETAGTGWSTTVEIDSEGAVAGSSVDVVLADGDDKDVTFTNRRHIPNAISHVVLWLSEDCVDEGTTVKINYPDEPEINDPSQPWSFEGCSIMDEDELIIQLNNICDYIIKTAGAHYDPYGNNITDNLPEWYDGGVSPGGALSADIEVDLDDDDIELECD